MADFLTIDSTPWEVQSTSAPLTTTKIGTVRRAFSGALRSSRRNQFLEGHGWQTAPLTPATAALFELYDDGALHTVDGTIFGNVPLQALIAISQSDPVPDLSEPLGFKIVHTFDVQTT